MINGWNRHHKSSENSPSSDVIKVVFSHSVGLTVKEKAQQRHDDNQDDGEDMDTASGHYEERNCGDMERDLDENNVSDDTLGSNGDYSLPWEHWKQTSNDPSGYSQMAQPGVY